MPRLIDHAIFGSLSGRHDYRVLAASAGAERSLHGILEHHASLAGSAQMREATGWAFSFFALDQGRWAFTRTTFLGMRERGNDYVVHVLLLPTAVLDWIRWDIFLLETLFSMEKREGALEALALPELLRVQSARPCGSELAVDSPLRPLVASALVGLSSGAVALEVPNPAAGIGVCRGAMSVLPPSDREGLSFSTYYSYARAPRFRLALHLAEDASLVPGGPQRPAAAVPDLAGWSRALSQAVPPLAGLSVLHKPESAARLAGALPIARRLAVSLHAEAVAQYQRLEEGLRVDLAAVVTNPANRDLPGSADLAPLAILDELERRLTKALATGSLAELRAFADSIRQAESPQRVNQLLALCSTVWHGNPTRRVAMLEFLSPESLPHAVYGTAPGCVFRELPSLAGWIRDLSRTGGRAGLTILTNWVISLRVANGLDAIHELAQVAREILRGGSDGTASTGVGYLGAAIEAAAAAPGDESPRNRKSWLSHYARSFGSDPAIATAFSPVAFARLAVSHGFLGDLSADELAPLLPALVDSYPEHLAKALEKPAGSELPLALLRSSPGDLLLGTSDTSSAPWAIAFGLAEQATASPWVFQDRALSLELVRLLSAMAFSHPAPGRSGENRASFVRLGRVLVTFAEEASPALLDHAERILSRYRHAAEKCSSEMPALAGLLASMRVPCAVGQDGRGTEGAREIGRFRRHQRTTARAPAFRTAFGGAFS